jgi:hypothetical protein
VKCVASIPGQNDILIKLLSVDPNNYPDAPVEAIRRVLEKATGRSYPKEQKISLRGVGTSGDPRCFSVEQVLTRRMSRIYQNGHNSSHECSARKERRENRIGCDKGVEGSILSILGNEFRIDIGNRTCYILAINHDRSFLTWPSISQMFYTRKSLRSPSE